MLEIYGGIDMAFYIVHKWLFENTAYQGKAKDVLVFDTDDLTVECVQGIDLVPVWDSVSGLVNKLNGYVFVNINEKRKYDCNLFTVDWKSVHVFSKVYYFSVWNLYGGSGLYFTIDGKSELICSFDFKMVLWESVDYAVRVADLILIRCRFICTSARYTSQFYVFCTMIFTINMKFVCVMADKVGTEYSVYNSSYSNPVIESKLRMMRLSV